MTVIRPNSVSGITSITAQANEINFFRSNGTLAGLQLNGVNFNTTTGISTLAALKITGNLDVEGVLTYQDVTNVDSVGIITARQGVRVTADGSPSSNYISVGASNDLKIYHSGSHSRILDDATGKLQLGSDTEVEILNGSFNESMAKFQPNGAVELYHNNSKKFDTITTGIRVHGDEGGTAQLQLLADQGDDNADYWRFIAETDGTLNMQDYGSGNWYNNIRLNGHTGGVELYHDNSNKFQTTSTGAQVNASSSVDGLLVTASLEGTVTVADQRDASYKASFLMAGSAPSIRNQNTSTSDRTLSIQKGGSTVAYWDGNGHYLPGANNTYDIGSTSVRWKNIYSEELNVTKGSGNLSAYFTASNGLGTLEIGGSTGAFIDLKTPASDDLDFRIGTGGSGGYMNVPSGQSISVQGHFNPSANNSYDLGTSSVRWRNIFTNDLNLSNEGGKNDVDGTWGNYTIQEGESDLFLINKRNGKKYKFNLTEVS